MGLRIEVAVDESNQRSLLFSHGRVIVGRGRGVDVHLPDTSVSAQHLALECIGGHWTATDMDSSNGSWLAGSRLIPGRPARIESDGPLQVGTVVLQLKLEPVAQGSTNAQTQTLARALLRAELASEGHPCEGPSVIVLSELGQGIRRTLQPGERLMVGRGDSCGLCIPDAELSREHLLIEFVGHSIELIDQHTKNGSRIGNRTFERTSASGGDHIHIGATTLLIEDPVDDLLGERVELPDEKLALPRASRVPQAKPTEKALSSDGTMKVAESGDDATGTRSKEKSNRKLAASSAASTRIAGGDRLLLGFALLLVLVSGVGLWLLFR